MKITDLIDRQEALEGLYDVFFDDELSAAYPNEADKVLDVIRKLPSAQPERKRGKWITVLGRLGNEVECNQCHSVFWYWMGNYRFCPSCGARMDGESDE